MQAQQLITAFSALGKLLQSLSDEEIFTLTRKSSVNNNWFTERNIRLALQRITYYLKEDNLQQWLHSYHLPEENINPKKIGLVLPGHFPGAGFPDFLSVLVTGNELHAKLNEQDPALLPFIADELCQIEPSFREKIFFDTRLKGMDAMLATEMGSSPRYMEQYFKKLPYIIRKHRKSVAILTGGESSDELVLLGKDITQYYGLDNRSVSKVFVPEGYDFTPLFEALESFSYIKDHHKFVNNYDFNKSLFLVNLIPHLDNGFLLFKEDKAMISPISVLFHQPYRGAAEIEQHLKEQQDLIECVIGNSPLANTPFGKANEPELWDYVDGKDTIAFLKDL